MGAKNGQTPPHIARYMVDQIPSCMLWGVMWNSKNDRHIMYQNCLPAVFRTRAEAMIWIQEHYGYIKNRKDLRSAPFYWRMPVPVKVKVVELHEKDD